MTIKEASQRGNQVIVRCGSGTTQVGGILVGYTEKAVFINTGNMLKVFVYKNGCFTSSGYAISIKKDDEIKMYGNKAGIRSGNRINLIDEDGRPAGSRSV